MNNFVKLKNYKPLVVGIILLLSILCLPLILAQDYLPQKIDTSLDLVISSNNATQCNISSIQYSDGSAILLILNMTRIGNDFNYTIDSGNFSLLGDICFGIACVDSIANIETGSICRTVTPNGVVQSTAQGIGGAVFLGLMLVLTFIFGWTGFKLAESDKLWILGIFFLFLSVLFMVYDVWLGYEYHRNFTGNADSSMPEIIFYVFMFLLVAGFVISLLLLFTHWKEYARYIKREIKDKDYNLKEDEFDREFE